MGRNNGRLIRGGLASCFTPASVYGSPWGEIFAIPGKKTKTELTDILVAPKISTASLLSVKPEVPSGELVVLVFFFHRERLFPQLCSAVFVIHLSHENLAQESEIGAPPPKTPPALVPSQPVGLGSIPLLENPSLAKPTASYMYPTAGKKKKNPPPMSFKVTSITRTL